MSGKLKELMARAEQWPPAEQEALAAVMLDIENRSMTEEITPEDLAIIDQRIATDKRASDEEVAALFNKYRK
jgi:hypothetical protein